MSPTSLRPRPEPGRPLPEWLGRLLCRVGWHDDELIDARFGFGPRGTVEHVRCRRCRRAVARRGRR